MEGTKPLLLPNTVVSTDTASRAGVLLTIADIEQWDSFRRLLDYCDGKHTAQQIAEELLLDITTINKALTSLESAGFIWCLTDYQSIPTPLFLTEFNRWLPIWVDRMYDQPVWQGLYDGVEPASLLIGWAQENMHHTRSVMSHMPRAIEYANDKTGQNTQFRHLREEWDHYRLFMSACHSTGIDMSKLDNSPPLASTTNITYFMNSVAKMGTLVYNACEALLEATTQNGHSVADFYQTAGRQLALPQIFTDQLIHHLRVDQEFEHIDIFEHLLEDYPTLPAQTVTQIFTSCHRLTNWFEMWHDDIYQHYHPSLSFATHNTLVNSERLFDTNDINSTI
ncbi:hypothetical protein AXW37_00870 [Yersinia ruckeri]|uniref:Uncharacterized protein n=1 Tax=Yersinia ruckeri TaxID=29486 RepID=A0A085U724_YERRU|nr:MarR family transcriptional regulator [Yersinia ruckeri]AKA38865.1 hypothetical protein UGYR_10985 [Yersinia ruckeri]ARY99511.1 hypothetical protein QMA0440_00129 [Yersinia ruckeri]AUQ41683.1 MarR family transcriptional regulator [Yersinia ruckeri]EEP99959.1 hypothetical protein yruck0001_27050 [Yersinia ruckeri ATCC 29473]EKN4183534.1 MarR family transcriptional regulator [Yersinia ruckeri]